MYEWQQSNAGRAAVKAAKKKLGSANKKITKKQLQSEVASLKQALADKERGSDSASANEIQADTQSNNSSSTKSFSVDEVRAMISEYRKRPTSFDEMEVSEASLQLSQVLKRQRN